MSSFARRWLRFWVGVGALLLVAVFARRASAYAGEHNINTGVATAGEYITSTQGGCPGCHNVPTASFFGVNPVLSIVSGGSGSGTSFSVQPGATARFHLTFNNNGASGGFLVFHDTTSGGSNDAQGTLVATDFGTHSCPDGGGNPNGTICPPAPFTTTNGNTEVMHSFPQSGGSSSFFFDYVAPNACSGTFSFDFWVNSENGDSVCNTPDSAYEVAFTISIAACDDGNACTSNTCSFGFCSFPTAVFCPGPDQCHNPGTCNPGTGACSNPAKGNGTGCNDSDACTQTDTCQGGICTGSNPIVCSALDQCHIAGSCSGGVCSNPAKGNGTGCNDLNACTQSDTCQGGTCTGANPVVCPAPDQCHSAGSCNTGTGVCSNPPLGNGTGCTDFNSCTVGDTCQGGVCQSGPGMTCPAPDQCHNPVSCSGGVCPLPTAKGNGTGCNDGSACTTNDTCQGGTCTGGAPPPCDDGLPCSTDGCNPASGCTHTAVANGTQCSAASCTSGTATPRENCDGSLFTCPTATPVSCGGAVCSGTSCSGGCNGDDTLCTAGNFCSPANVCQPKQGDGTTCGGDNFCTNGHCVDGRCCNSACGNGDLTDCQACNLPGKLGVCSVPVGTVCRAAAAGRDCDAAEVCATGNVACPADVPVPAAANQQCRASSDGNLCDAPETCNGVSFTCPADTPTRVGTVCRPSGGVCDPAESCVGNGCPTDTLDTTSQCRPNAAGTNCDKPEFCGTNGTKCPADTFQGNVSCRAAACSSGTATAAANCPGNAASCPAIVNTDCTPYVCQGTACGTTCNVKTDCDIGFYCNPAKKCVPELPPGGVCTTAESCGTGICVDGRCCNSQCTGQCQACDVPNKLGICSPVPGTDKIPHGTRPKCTGDATTCHGFCDGTITATCAMPGATTQCVAPSCTAGVATPVEVCNGSGTCPTQPNVPCAPGICQAASGPKAICVGGGGTPCVSDVECLSDHYCLVGQCKPKNPDGGTCAADDQCTNGHCVDGLCCNSSCDGQCEACDVSGKKGVCSPITAADTPHSGRQACTSDPQFSGCAGQCDGKNRLTCVYPGAGTLCRDASCTKDIATLPAYCTGTGTCSPPQQQACDVGAGCNTAGTICKNGCTADRDCSLGKYCSGGVCVPTVPQGDPCSTSSQCAGACVDGVCCNTTCDHQCEACNVPNKLGICTAVTGAPVLPRAGCATDGTAACAGKCNGVNHDACTYPGSTTQCAAGACADGVATLTDFCDGAGSCPAPQHQICAPDDCAGTKCGGACAVSGTCPAGQYCSGGECVTKLPPKSVCNQDTDCANGICTDGFCCDSACTGQCQACDVPGSQGVCTTVSGASPHGGRAACAGFGSCGALCDGTSPTACAYAGATTSCGRSTCAVDGEQLAAPLCNGAGACLPATGINCGAYTCDPPSGICLISCVLGSDCAPGFDCVNAKCTQGNDAGVDSGAGGAPDMPDASMTTDASDDGAVPDTGTDAADTGAGGETDGGPVLVPPSHSTDKGSCGCRVPGSSESGPSNGLLIASALALLGVAGRRRRRAVEAGRFGRDLRP